MNCMIARFAILPGLTACLTNKRIQVIIQSIHGQTITSDRVEFLPHRLHPAHLPGTRRRSSVCRSYLRGDLDDAVGHGLHELVVVRGEQYDAREADHTVVEGDDAFHIQVVGGLSSISTLGFCMIILLTMQRTFRHRLATFVFFMILISAEEHLAQESTQEILVYILGCWWHVLAQPVHQVRLLPVNIRCCRWAGRPW